LANISLKKSIQLFDTRDVTNWKDIKRVLKLLNIKFNNKIQKMNKSSKKPKLCIVSIKFTNKYATHSLHHYEDVYYHFTLWYDGIFYDPSEGKIKKFECDQFYDVKEISYMQIYKRR